MQRTSGECPLRLIAPASAGRNKWWSIHCWAKLPCPKRCIPNVVMIGATCKLCKATVEVTGPSCVPVLLITFRRLMKQSSTYLRLQVEPTWRIALDGAQDKGTLRVFVEHLRASTADDLKMTEEGCTQCNCNSQVEALGGVPLILFKHDLTRGR